MAQSIPRSFIDDLIIRIDIVDFINSYVPLKKSGNNHVACCPFHKEKTPSFSVTQDKQFYHCFGCGVGGNIISFLMAYNNLSFVEAIEDLASFAGVNIPHEATTSQPQQNLETLFQLNQKVANFYTQKLKNQSIAKQAITYLKNRGLNDAIVRDFMLGYAPNKWNNLDTISQPLHLLEAGLQARNNENKQYDYFRNRIIFPIRDKRGRIVGFGGRVMDDSPPKYLNSPETTLFKKSKEVYGLYELLQKNSKPERILIVEGYMDVIALAQFGINYAVASLGTASSRSHFDLLFRFTSELILCFDGDRAGHQATWRAVEAALPSLRDDRQIRIMLLPEDQDPDSLIRASGSKQFSQKISASQPLSDYFFNYLTKNINLNDLEGRSLLINKAHPLLDQLSNSNFRNMMLERLKHEAKTHTLNISASISKPRIAENQGKSPLSRIANALLLQNPQLANSAILVELERLNLTSPGLDLLDKTLKKISQKTTITLGGLLEAYRNHPEEKLIASLAKYNNLTPHSGLHAEFEGAIKGLIKQAQKKKLEELLAKGKKQELDLHEKKIMLKLLDN